MARILEKTALPYSSQDSRNLRSDTTGFGSEVTRRGFVCSPPTTISWDSKRPPPAAWKNVNSTQVTRTPLAPRNDAVCLNLRRHALADNHEALILVERYGQGLIYSEILPVVVCETQGLVALISAEDVLQRIDVEPHCERRVLERLSNDVTGRAAPLQLDDYDVPPVIYAKQVDDAAEVGSHLAADDQNPLVFKNPVGIGLQPFLEDGFLVLDLKGQLLVLRESAVRLNAEDSHVCSC